MPNVILLRSADDPDPYVAALAEAGLEAVCVPVLSFAFPFQTELREHLQERERYEGLIVTSPRAVRAVEDAVSRYPELASDWRGTSVYVVGPKTDECARGLGLNPRGQKTGGAEALAAYIAREDHTRPLLFLSGNRRRDTLPKELRAGGVAFDEQVVYETRFRENLALPEPAEDTAMWLVFFSPSGLEVIQRTQSVEPNSYRLAAIGPTTASALEASNLPVQAVAETPSPGGLVRALVAADPR